jgi:hypothetical protein
VIRPLRAELVEPAERRRRAGAGAPPRGQRVARRTEGCPSRPSGPASRGAKPRAGAPSSELSALAQAIHAGLRSAEELTVGCDRFARLLLGSAESLLKRAVALGADTTHVKQRGERPVEYALHWPSAYESDVWA